MKRSTSCLSSSSSSSSSSIRRRQKVSDEATDRLSALPDEVLGHILSFLSTKKSISTSVLARRWRFLWTNYVHNLDFSTSHFKSGMAFLTTIQRVMSLHNVRRLNTFRLFCLMEDCDEHDVESWISPVIARNVVNINMTLDYSTMLPRCLFTSKTLVDLSIRCTGGIPAGAKYLPALKKLHLGYVYYESDDSLSSLLSGCPVLEELNIERMVVGPDMVCCSISSPTLIKLVLEFRLDYKIFKSKAFRLKIDTPALRYLKVEDSVSENISARALTSVIEADIYFHYEAPTDARALYSRSMFGFVTSLSNLKCLHLFTYPFGLDVPDSTFSDLTTKYHNLTKLKLNADCRFLPYFLTNAENLEVLILFRPLRLWMKPHQVPTCLLSHLRTVKIEHFTFREAEFDMVKYVLLNARVLKTMEIHFLWHRSDPEGKSKHATKKISLFQRGSEACELAFHCY